MSTQRRALFTEIDEKTGEFRFWWTGRDFAALYPEFVRSYTALRRQIQHRHKNGLLSSRAAMETRYGTLLEPNSYRAWVLSPRDTSHSEAA